jgi:hypothetical protein
LFRTELHTIELFARKERPEIPVLDALVPTWLKVNYTKRIMVIERLWHSAHCYFNGVVLHRRSQALTISDLLFISM